jgi:hypothetical protein
LLDRIGDEEYLAVFRLEHSFGDTVIEEGEELVVEAVEVEQEDRLLMKLEGLPGEDLEHLLEGAKAARKNDEGVGLFAHESLTGVHGVGDVKLGYAVVGYFEIDEDLWDNADDTTSGGERRFGNSAHETDSGPTVDEADVSLSEGATEVFGGFAVDGISSICGGAEDSYVLNHQGKDIKAASHGSKTALWIGDSYGEGSQKADRNAF